MLQPWTLDKAAKKCKNSTLVVSTGVRTPGRVCREQVEDCSPLFDCLGFLEPVTSARSEPRPSRAAAEPGAATADPGTGVLRQDRQLRSRASRRPGDRAPIASTMDRCRSGTHLADADGGPSLLDGSTDGGYQPAGRRCHQSGGTYDAGGYPRTPAYGLACASHRHHPLQLVAPLPVERVVPGGGRRP